MRRWMFSTTTIASSTRMPIEKMSANSDTRLIVKPQAQEANSVAASVTTTAAPTTIASRRPIASQHQQHHRERREHQLLDELLRLVVGGHAVVAGDRDLDALGNVGAAQLPTRSITRVATSIAFSPGFFETAIVTAGAVPPSVDAALRRRGPGAEADVLLGLVRARDGPEPRPAGRPAGPRGRRPRAARPRRGRRGTRRPARARCCRRTRAPAWLHHVRGLQRADELVDREAVAPPAAAGRA